MSIRSNTQYFRLLKYPVIDALLSMGNMSEGVRCEKRIQKRRMDGSINLGWYYDIMYSEEM